MIEKSIQDFLNAGIGLFKVTEDNLKGALGNLEKTFEDLKTKGAQDNSEAAVKMREIADRTARSLRDISSRSEANWNVALAEMQKVYSQGLEQMRKVVGDDKLKEFSAKFEELAGYMKQKTQSKPDSGQGEGPKGA